MDDSSSELQERIWNYCPDPVFVIGAPRSGTTALGLALGQHSHFHAGDESLFLIELFNECGVKAVFERWAGRPSSSWLRREGVSQEEFLAALGVGINALFTSRSHGLRWVDHTPGHALIAPLLAGLFPGAKFLHLVRDGRAVVQSMLNVSRTMKPEDADRMLRGHFLPPWSHDFRKACECWSSHVRAACAFGHSHADRCLLVEHRQIEANPTGSIAAILDFFDVPFEGEPIDFLSAGWLNSSYGNAGVGTAIRIERPDPLTIWSDEEKGLFLEICGQQMRELGFP